MTRFENQVRREIAAMSELGFHSPSVAARVSRYLDTDEGIAQIADLEQGGCRVSDAADTLIALASIPAAVQTGARQP